MYVYNKYDKFLQKDYEFALMKECKKCGKTQREARISYRICDSCRQKDIYASKKRNKQKYYERQKELWQMKAERRRAEALLSQRNYEDV